MFGLFKKKEPEKTPEKEYLVITLRKKIVESKEFELITGQHILTFEGFDGKVREIKLDYQESINKKENVYHDEINKPQKFEKNLYTRCLHNHNTKILEIYDTIYFGGYGQNLMYHSRPDDIYTDVTLENIHRFNQIENKTRDEFIPTKTEVLIDGTLINVKHWISCSFNILSTRKKTVDIFHFLHDRETLTESEFNSRLEEYNRISSN